MIDDGIDLAGEAKQAYKKSKRKKNAEAAPLTRVDDPLLAAAILLVSLAEVRGPLTREDEDSIGALITNTTGQKDVSEALADARWASQKVPDVNQVIRRLLPLWKDKLVPHERKDLVHMAQAVCDLRKEPDPIQSYAMRQLRQGLGLLRKPNIVD